ncbi:MAG TPA: MFS transporter [Nocardioidaceae bacterium]|nr:MFS transporter [Nocardioidaceae bacterium]
MTGRLQLGIAAVAVAFAAADTYVVVLALPDMMAGVGLSIDELQRAAPIVSGFLLGYVATLPLAGRIADLRGRVPVLVGSLLVFAFGSLVTAGSYDLASMVAGRFLQGVGAGGLVPATLALVADLYPRERRGVPLGVVGAVQELGSVLGPLYGAAILAVTTWQVIFAVNVVVGVVLVLALRASGFREGRRGRTIRARKLALPPGPATTAPPLPAAPSPARRDVLGATLGLLALLILALVLVEPPQLTARVSVGLAFVPVVGGSRWLSPLGIAFVVLAVAFWIRCATTRRPLVGVRRWPQLARESDPLGAGLLALVLAGIVMAFATADPQVSVFSPAGPWLLLGSALAAVAWVWQRRRSPAPLVPRATFAHRHAQGSLLVSFLTGAALIAGLVDVPIFARITVSPTSQLGAALVLVRLLTAIPVGALLGGWALRRCPAGVLTALAMALTTGAFWWMSTWGAHSLAHPVATVPLVAAGLGFGLAIAPVNAVLLASTPSHVHGVASALLVVARMVGMLVGISVLTTVGLRRYYAVQAGLPAPSEVCHTGTQCPAYTAMLEQAGLAQLQTVFVGAAICAALAGAAALAMFGSARPGRVHAAGSTDRSATFPG